jgi:hypothetical protein
LIKPEKPPKPFMAKAGKEMDNGVRLGFNGGTIEETIYEEM